jgi:hypothetical protein
MAAGFAYDPPLNVCRPGTRGSRAGHKLGNGEKAYSRILVR